MTSELKTIHIADDSELARALDEGGGASLRLVRGNTTYRLSREDVDLWTDYDPAKVRAAVRATAGSWADLDTDALIADLYRAREEGSRPAHRP